MPAARQHRRADPRHGIAPGYPRSVNDRTRPSSRSSCPSTTRARPSSRSSGRLSAGVTTPHELVVVYDFDEDTTVPVIARLAAEIPGLRGLRNDLGRGVLNAMKAGIAGTTAPYVLISMADGSDEPHVVDPMVALARGGADVVVGAAATCAAATRSAGRSLKRLMSRTAGLTLHWFAGVPTHDPTNNFKLYSRRFLDSRDDRERGRLRARPRADRQGDARRAAGRRGADDLARPDRRPEQLQAPQVAAPLPPLVPRRVPRPAPAPRRTAPTAG